MVYREIEEWERIDVDIGRGIWLAQHRRSTFANIELSFNYFSEQVAWKRMI